MRLISLELESKMREKALWPQSRTAWAALYVLALDLLLFAVQWLARRASPAMSASLTDWAAFLRLLAISLVRLAGLRWLPPQLLALLPHRLYLPALFIARLPVF